VKEREKNDLGSEYAVHEECTPPFQDLPWFWRGQVLSFPWYQGRETSPKWIFDSVNKV